MEAQLSDVGPRRSQCPPVLRLPVLPAALGSSTSSVVFHNHPAVPRSCCPSTALTPLLSALPSNQMKTSAAVPVKKNTQRLGWALGTSSCGSTAVISAAFSSCLHSRPQLDPNSCSPYPAQSHKSLPASPTFSTPYSKCLDPWSTLGSASWKSSTLGFACSQIPHPLLHPPFPIIFKIFLHFPSLHV